MKFSESLSDLHVSEVAYQWLRLGLVNRRTYSGFGTMSKKSAAAHGLQVKILIRNRSASKSREEKEFLCSWSTA